jgi:hypothetical protein
MLKGTNDLPRRYGVPKMAGSPSNVLPIPVASRRARMNLRQWQTSRKPSPHGSGRSIGKQRKTSHPIKGQWSSLCRFTWLEEFASDGRGLQPIGIFHGQRSRLVALRQQLLKGVPDRRFLVRIRRLHSHPSNRQNLLLLRLEQILQTLDLRIRQLLNFFIRPLLIVGRN